MPDTGYLHSIDVKNKNIIIQLIKAAGPVLKECLFHVLFQKPQPFQHIGLWDFDKVNIFRPKKNVETIVFPKIHIFIFKKIAPKKFAQKKHPQMHIFWGGSPLKR